MKNENDVKIGVDYCISCKSDKITCFDYKYDNRSVDRYYVCNNCFRYFMIMIQKRKFNEVDFYQ